MYSYWKAMKEIINTFFQLLNQMLSLLGILGVFILIFTTMGIRLFGERYTIVPLCQGFDNKNYW